MVARAQHGTSSRTLVRLLGRLLGDAIREQHGQNLFNRVEEVRRRHASLRWGIILVALAGGFALIQQGDWHELTPGMIAVLAGATGLGNLVYFAVARKIG